MIEGRSATSISNFNQAANTPFFSTPNYQLVLTKLTDGVSTNNRLMLLTGEPGTGKTFVARKIIDRFSTEPYSFFLGTLGCALNGLLSDLFKDLAFHDVAMEVDEKLELLQRAMPAKADKGRAIVLIVDDAHTISQDLIGHLVSVASTGLRGSSSLQLILVGSPELESKLLSPVCQHLLPHNFPHVRLEPFWPAAAYAYTRYRLQEIEGREDLFSSEALRRIAVLSKGRPRTINALCDLAIVLAEVEAKSRVTASMVDEIQEGRMLACGELDFDLKLRAPASRHRAVAGMPAKMTNWQNDRSKPRHTIESHDRSDCRVGQVITTKTDAQPGCGTRTTRSRLRLRLRYRAPQIALPTIPSVPPETVASFGGAEKQGESLLEPQKPWRVPMAVTLPALAVAALLMIVMTVFEYTESGKRYSLYPPSNSGNNKGSDLSSSKVQGNSAISDPLSPVLAGRHPTATEFSRVSPSERFLDERAPPTPAKEDKSEKQATESVASLLARADRQMSAERLTTPAGDAALETYRQILRIAPEHGAALQGIQAIETRYMVWSKAAAKRGDWAQVREYLQKLVVVDPQSHDFKDIWRQLKTAEVDEKRLNREAVKHQRDPNQASLEENHGRATKKSVEQDSGAATSSGSGHPEDSPASLALRAERNGNLRNSLPIVEERLEKHPHNSRLQMPRKRSISNVNSLSNKPPRADESALPSAPSSAQRSTSKKAMKSASPHGEEKKVRIRSFVTF